MSSLVKSLLGISVCGIAAVVFSYIVEQRRKNNLSKLQEEQQESKQYEHSFDCVLKKDAVLTYYKCAPYSDVVQQLIIFADRSFGSYEDNVLKHEGTINHSDFKIIDRIISGDEYKDATYGDEKPLKGLFCRKIMCPNKQIAINSMYAELPTELDSAIQLLDKFLESQSPMLTYYRSGGFIGEVIKLEIYKNKSYKVFNLDELSKEGFIDSNTYDDIYNFIYSAYNFKTNYGGDAQICDNVHREIESITGHITIANIKANDIPLQLRSIITMLDELS